MEKLRVEDSKQRLTSLECSCMRRWVAAAALASLAIFAEGCLRCGVAEGREGA